MATAKVVLFKSKTLSNGEHPLMLQVIKDRKKKYFSIGHSCHPNDWNKKDNCLGKSHPNYKRLIIKIKEEEKKANALILDYENEEVDFSLDEFAKKLRDPKRKVTVDAYFDEWIAKYQKLGKIGNSRAYKDSQKAIRRFQNNNDINFSEINISFLKKFEEFYLLRGVKPNSISVYLRTLRSLFNKAIEDNIVKKDYYPFDKYKISKLTRPTLKRAIPKVDIKKIVSLDLDEETSLWHSRNYFMFSFYNMGMNFMDITLLKWENIQNGRIHYERSKTGKLYSLELLPPAIEILDYYKTYNAGYEYVFPIIKPEIHNTPQSIYNRIERCRKITNADLKTLAKMAGIEKKMTTYVARHSLATILKHSGVSTSIISEGLGHATERTTQIYLDSFESETLDKANKKLLT